MVYNLVSSYGFQVAFVNFWVCFHESAIKFWGWAVGVASEWLENGIEPQKGNFGKVSELSSAVAEVSPSLPGRAAEEIAKNIAK